MSNHLKAWWERRKTKHYLKNHWHLFADIALLTIILCLMSGLIIINQSANHKIDTATTPHVPKITATTTNEALVIKTDVDKNNVHSGESFTLHLSLKNNSDKDVTNIILKPEFFSNSFSISKIENNKLVLDKLVAGDSVESDILVTINARTGSPREINWSLKTTYKTDGQSYTNNYDLNALKLITNLKVTAEAYYNSQQGDQLGSGPIPPMLGLPTNYWIFFEVSGNDNDLSNLTISAKLPEGVALASRKTLSAGEFNYDESQKRITWTAKKVGVADGRYQVGFEVQLLPLAKQVGLNPLLVSNISYLVTDAYTGEKLSGKLPYIDTSLPLDAINKGQGQVVK